MKCVLVVALVLSLGHSSVALAAGPLLESALRSARQLAPSQAESPEAMEKLGPKLSKAKKVWIGVGVAVAAVVVVSVVAFYKQSESGLIPGGSGQTFDVVFSTDGSES